MKIQTIALYAALSSGISSTSFASATVEVTCHTAISLGKNGNLSYEFSGKGIKPRHLPDAIAVLDPSSVKAHVILSQSRREKVLIDGRGEKIHQDSTREVYSFPDSVYGLFVEFHREKGSISVRHFLGPDKPYLSDHDASHCIFP